MNKVLASIDAGYHEAPKELMNHVRKYVVPLLLLEGGRMKSIGTGTIISSWGAILTANHVLQAAVKAGRPRAKDGRRYQEYSLYALVHTGEPHPTLEGTDLGGLVQIVNIWTSDSLDVGFCAMGVMINTETNEPLTYHCLPLNLKPPVLGQRCFAMGFPESEGLSTDGITYDYREKLYTTDGEIIEVHHTGRDPVVLPYPSFTVRGYFEHKMSGGPVFLDGEVGVSGIISRGLGKTRSYASMIWPAMGIGTDLGESLPQTMYEATQSGFIPVVHNGYGIQLETGQNDMLQVRLTHP